MEIRKGHIKLNFQRLTITSLLSIMTHGVIILFLILKVNFFLPLTKKDKSLTKITPISTVGIKNGQEAFNKKMTGTTTENVQTIDEHETKPKMIIEKQSGQQYKQEKLKQLAPQNYTYATKQKKNVITPNNFTITPQEAEQIQKIRRLAIKKYSNETRNQNILQKTGFYFKFIPPKGIPEDELNSIEKIFYSFQKRTYQAYVSSLLSHYSQLLTTKPYIEKTLFEQRQELSGSITIDGEGNIVKVRFINPSDNKDVQDLFEKTLTGISSLPNPPKQLLQGEQLSIYFQLIISD